MAHGKRWKRRKQLKHQEQQYQASLQRQPAGPAAGWRGGSPRTSWPVTIIVISVLVVVLTVLALAEVGGVAQARHTVAHGWGTGLATGVAASFVLSAFIGGLVWTRRGPDLSAGRLLVGALTVAVSILAAFFCTAPHASGPGNSSYVVTSWVSVACMAYDATTLAQLVVVMICSTTAAYLRRRSARRR